MYDVNRKVFLPNTTVKQLIEQLNNYPEILIVIFT